MSTFEIMSTVENQIATIMRARAVLNEAEHYFDCKDTEDFLPYYAEQVSLLLGTVNILLYETLPEMSGVVNSLHQKLKEEKNGKESL